MFEGTAYLWFGWLLSLAALCATIAIVARLVKRRDAAESAVSAWAAYTIGVFIAIFCLLLSHEYAGLAAETGAPILLDALFESLKMFSASRDIGLDASALTGLGSAALAYKSYYALLVLAAPVGVLGTVVSLLGELFSAPRMWLRSRSRSTFVFSQLNEASFVLAKDIQTAGGGKRVALFANRDQADSELVGAAKEEGILCLPQNMPFIARWIFSGKAERTFVFSGPDEAKNIEDGGKLAEELAMRYAALPLEEKKNGNVPKVLMFSTSTAGGSVVDALAEKVNPDGAAGGGIDLRVHLQRVDWVRNTVDTLLDRYPLFTTGLDVGKGDIIGPDGEPAKDFGAIGMVGGGSRLVFDYAPDSRRILLVGSDEFSLEFLKGAIWASQMGDVAIRIDVVADDIDEFKQRFSFECPVLGAMVLDGPTEMEEPSKLGHFDLHFWNMDPQSTEYLDFLRVNADHGCAGESTDSSAMAGGRIGEFTYVVVSLGEDVATAQVARRTREMLEQRRLKTGLPPAFIAAVVEGREFALSIRRMKSRKQYYAIEPVGSMDQVYSYDNIFNPRMANYARNLNRVYGAYNINELGEDDPSKRHGRSGFALRVEREDRAFANSEYNQRSSLAAALHRKYSLFLLCRRRDIAGSASIDWMAPLDSIVKADPELLERYDGYIRDRDYAWLSEIEHCRWNAYMFTEGFYPASHDDVRRFDWIAERQNYDLARMHACLVDFGALPQLDGVMHSLGRREGEKPFQELDDDLLRGLGVITCIDETPKLAAFWKRWVKLFPEDDKPAEEPSV